MLVHAFAGSFFDIFLGYFRERVGGSGIVRMLTISVGRDDCLHIRFINLFPASWAIFRLLRALGTTVFTKPHQYPPRTPFHNRYATVCNIHYKPLNTPLMKNAFRGGYLRTPKISSFNLGILQLSLTTLKVLFIFQVFLHNFLLFICENAIQHFRHFAGYRVEQMSITIHRLID